MKNKKVIIPLVLLAIGGIIWGTILINSSKVEKKEDNIVFKIEQEDPHEGHNHGGHSHGEDDNQEAPIEGKIPKNANKLIEGDLTQPLFCNNGESVIFTDSKGNKLYYQKNENTSPVLLIEQSWVGNNVGWSKDCETVYFKEKTKDYKILIKSINVNTKEIKEYPNYPPQIELRSIAISDTVYYLDSKTLAVKAMYEDKKWDISTTKGNYYKLLISPNNKYIAAHLSANVMLFSTEGVFIRDLGRGIATDWSPDSKKLIGFMDEASNHHDISGSELYFFNLEGATPTQVTSTPNAFEMWPVFKNKNQIIYTDEINKGLFIMDI